MARASLLLLLALLVVAACDRRVEPYVPGEEPAAPDLSRIFPSGAGREAGAGPAEARRGAPSLAAEAGAPVRGTIDLAPEVASRVPSGAVLFLVARRGAGGPPLAVKRIPEPRFPLEFELGPEDRMITTLPFAGPLGLSARLDADGNASTRTPGDLQGVAPGPFEPGARDVEIVIDEIL